MAPLTEVLLQVSLFFLHVNALEVPYLLTIHDHLSISFDSI
jgi:hypothetical protein